MGKIEAGMQLLRNDFEHLIEQSALQALQYRHRLHSRPELAFDEHETSDFVAAILSGLPGLRVHRGLAGTGVAAVLGRAGPMIGLRAELDALPIHEKNTFAHRSQIDGRMHACGHDGHTAMLLGAATVLSQLYEDSLDSGRVCFIFQPAEENEGGARRMIDEGFLDRFPLQSIYAIHNWPAIREGVFGFKAGPIMAACDRFDLTVHGTGAHAAMPQNGSDTILASSALIQALHAMQSRKNPMEPAVLSVTSIHGGEAYNILPDRVCLRGTLRTFDPITRERLISQARHIIAGVESAYDVRIQFTLTEGYPATVNSEKETLFARDVAVRYFGEENVVYPVVADTGSEDFSCFLEKVPGSYIWLGSGLKAGGLHNPNYDFNDNLLKTGIGFWTALAMEFLRRIPV
jgi:hippurate hydrolase